MSTTKNHRRGKLQDKSSSFQGKPSVQAMETRRLRRPSQPTKLLLNVTMLGSIGPVHVVMSMDGTVADLIASAVKQYVKEGRRPVLPTTDPSRFDLHYSQFSLECLDRDEKLLKVWSRNLLLCPKKSNVECVGTKALGSSCAEEVQISAKATSPWLKFMDFLL